MFDDFSQQAQGTVHETGQLLCLLSCPISHKPTLKNPIQDRAVKRQCFQTANDPLTMSDLLASLLCVLSFPPMNESLTTAQQYVFV